MSDSNCNCGCQYSTPPWWVTMGFVPPHQSSGHVQTPVVVAPPAAGSVKPGTPVKPGFTPGTAASNVLGNTGQAIGNAAGAVVETPLNLVTGILGDAASGIGGIFGKIF